jgi:beta-glucosidase
VNVHLLVAATFDTELVHQVGEFLAKEAKQKAAAILLAPTCNIQRNPLGGRAFESFSEDPHLSGMMASAYVNGLQANGVAATIKHLVGNDQEHERVAADSVVSERALREVYLVRSKAQITLISQSLLSTFCFGCSTHSCWRRLMRSLGHT